MGLLLRRCLGVWAVFKSRLWVRQDFAVYDVTLGAKALTGSHTRGRRLCAREREGVAHGRERRMPKRERGRESCAQENNAGGNRTAHLYLSRKRCIKIPCDLREERGGETGEWGREEGSRRTWKAVAASPPRSAACPPQSAPPPFYSSIRDYSNVRPLSGLSSFLCFSSRPTVYSISASFQSSLISLFYAPSHSSALCSPRSSVMCSPSFLCSFCRGLLLPLLG
jgi:hypothetical protein